MNLIRHTKQILEIENFWSPKMCDDFISKSENIGYEPAMVQTESGQKIIESVRNNQRVLFEDKLLAESIWKNVKRFVDPQLGKSKAIGLNEMFRFYKGIDMLV